MKTKIKNVIKVSTWLPLFSGFYQSIWDTDIHTENEIEYINEQRVEKGLAPIDYDDIDWDYDQYQKDVVKGITTQIGNELIKMGLIKEHKLEKLVSPKEYNFSTDSINVQFILNDKNKKVIEKYLKQQLVTFSKHLLDTYTSRSGFCSSYSNQVSDWMDNINETLEHQHKLGAILDFILRNEDQLRESDIYEDLSGNGVTLQAKNYSELLEIKS